jgi:hypothetical protein
MISYFDTVIGAGRPAQWRAHETELADRLLAVQLRFGDTTHTTGEADYLIRFVVNDPGEEISVPHAFVVAADEAGLVASQRIERGQLEVVGSWAYTDDFLNGVEAAFIAFREALS